MASKPNQPMGWGLYDPRPVGDVSFIDLWDQTQRKIVYYPNGTVYSDTVCGKGRISLRPTWKKTKIRLLSGTTTKWRDPTNYRRAIFHQVTYQQGDYKIGNNRYLTHVATLDVTGILSGTQTQHQQRIIRFIYPSNTWQNPLNDVDVQDLKSRAETLALLKFASNKADMGVMLAESVKTANHLAKTGFDLWNAYRAARRGSWNEVGKILFPSGSRIMNRGRHAKGHAIGKDVSSRWLEYQYGWLPLMSDMKSLYDVLGEGLQNALLLHSHHTAKTDKSLSGTRVNGTSTLTTDGKVDLMVKCKITGQLSAAAARNASRLGLTNPATIAWELVPFSFVVDWSIPVGNVLEALQATRGTTFVGGSYTVASQAAMKLEYRQNWTNIVQLPQGEWFKYQMERTPYSSFPTPSLYAKSPFSTSHIVSAVALLRQLV